MKDFIIRRYDTSRWEMRMAIRHLASSVWGQDDTAHGVYLFEPSRVDDFNIFLAYLDEVIVGYSISHYATTGYEWPWHHVNKEGLSSLEIDEIVVAQDYRFIGIGQALGQHLTTLARVNQCAIVRALSVNTLQELFYEKLGFQHGLALPHEDEKLRELKASHDGLVRNWNILLHDAPILYRELGA